MADNYNSSVNPNANQGLTPPVPPEPAAVGASASGGMVASLDSLSDDDIVKKQNFGETPVENQSQAAFFVPSTGQTEVLVQSGAGPSLPEPPAPATGVAALEVAPAPKKKRQSPLPIVLLALLLLGVGGWAVWNFFLKPKPAPVVVAPQAIVLDYWGLWEPSEALDRVLRNFEAANQGISVHYMKQSITGYRQMLQETLQSGTGPDVFRYHATWVPQLSSELAGMPASVHTVDSFRQNYYPVMANQLIETTEAGERVVGLPLMYEGMALLYNKQELAAKEVEVPRTWGDFQVAANRLTETAEDGMIEFAGAAMGLADNIDSFSDVLALLIVQNGGDLNVLNSQEVMDALSFYTSFYNPTGSNVRVWDETFDSSTLAFARGEVAMIFAQSWAVHDILAINPTLEIGVAPLPQLNDREPVSVASYWVEGVNADSERQEAAWKLLAYMSDPAVLEALYQEQVQLRNFGEMYPRPDMADMQANDLVLQPYLSQAPYAVAHYFTGKTFDEALDDGLIGELATAVNELNAGTRPDRVADRFQQAALRLKETFGLSVE